MFTETILPAIISAAIPILLALIGWASRAAVGALNEVAQSHSESAFASLAAQVGMRLTTTIDGVIDSAATETQGVLAKMQRPESPGGIDVTPEEWEQVRLRLLARVKAGFGKPWLERMSELILGNIKADPTPLIMDAIESRVAQRTDIALANGLRLKPPAGKSLLQAPETDGPF